jgi:hypothetical protein
MNTYEILQTGNFQARVLQDIAPFKSGEDVHISLASHGQVAVLSMDEQRYHVYALEDTREYDRYFGIY